MVQTLMENKYFNAPNQSNCSFLKESFWIWSYSYIIKLLAGFCSEKYPAQVPVVRNKNLKLKAHLQVAVVRACDFESSFAGNVKYHTSAEIPCHITLQPKISILEPVLNCCFVVFVFRFWRIVIWGKKVAENFLWGKY